MKSTKRKPLPFATRPNPREKEREQRQRGFLRFLAHGESIGTPALEVPWTPSCLRQALHNSS